MSQPQHVAVIMDGNGRWGEKRLLPRVVGHQKGLDALRTLVQSCYKYNIPVLTVFAFSSENWNRPREEVNALMKLFSQALDSEIHMLCEQGVRFRIIGDKTKLSKQLAASIDKAEQLTQNNSTLVFNVAMNYGGRWDILQAIQKLVHHHPNQGNTWSDLDVLNKQFSKNLCLHGFPPPDLLIRTGGEQRVSNFLLWDLAYTELFFTPVLWPDFTIENLDQALDFFKTRDRRFGQVRE